MTKRNFLIGKGERLTESISFRSGGAPKAHPYTFLEARTRLAPMLSNAIRKINELPDKACPENQAVISLTLNPEYIAKSYFPHDLLRENGITSIGSRPRKITPSKRSRNRTPVEMLTTELFVVGSRDTLTKWSSSMSNWTETTPGNQDIVTLEEIAAPSPHQKIKGALHNTGSQVLEVVLHTDELLGEKFMLHQFSDYLRELGFIPTLEKRFYAGGLCFLELEAPVELADQIAAFSIVRAIREMPRLRMLRPTIRSSSIPTQELQLPTQGAISPDIRVAVFDGGLPNNHPFSTWVTAIDAPGIGNTHAEYLKHGTGVTSALLFGHIDPTHSIPRPFANVDHYRVLDDEPGLNPHELFDVLDRIDKVLSSTEYDFINLSLGPRLPVEDDDVHAWTAVLDHRLSHSNTLATIAVGNDGEGDAILGLNRIQVPADCVNALAIGACDTPDDQWQRASYSSVGPGRSPGLIKPDIVEFGGSMQRPFLVIDEENPPSLDATGGTSFASPSVLRLATGVRAHFGTSLGHLAIRTLLIHSTEESTLPRGEVGWGRIARSIDDIVICDDDTIRVVYQGTISPAKYIRAQVPLPPGDIPGNTVITATLCYKSQVDPHHPGNYTRAGFEVTFRPHDQKFSRPEQAHPNTKSFFGASNPGMSEDELRRDSWKWENCLHATRTFRGKSLRNPCFDIHYNSRLEGRNFTPEQPLPYALVITIHAKHISDLYDQIIRKYATQLEPLKPTIDIPVQI